MPAFVRFIIYAFLLMATPIVDTTGGVPWDWTRSVPGLQDLVKTVRPAPVVTPPTIYSGGGGGAIAPPQPGVGPGHFNMPDYASLIQGDPGYAGVAASASAETGAAARNRANMIRQALIAFGAAPASWQSGYGDVSEADLAAARQNPFSTQAQLQQQRIHGSSDLAAALGARGMWSSGALTGGEQLLQRNFDKAQTDATQALLQALSGYEGNYADIARSLEQQRLSAYTDASGRVASLYPAQWVPDNLPQPEGGAPGAPTYTTYEGIGATPEAIGPQPLVPAGTTISPNQTAITPDMVAPPNTATFNQTVKPPSKLDLARYARLASLGG